MDNRQSSSTQTRQTAQKSTNRGPAKLSMAPQKARNFWLPLDWKNPINILIPIFFVIFWFILAFEGPHIPLTLLINALILVSMGSLLAYSQIIDIIQIHRSPACALYAIPTSGRFAIAGQAQGEVVISPIAEAPCVFWQVEVKEKQGRYWQTIYQDASQAPFEIKDDTGKITIFPQNPKIILSNTHQESSGPFSHINDITLLKLQQINIKTKGALGFDKSLKVSERLIKPDQLVYALGKIQDLEKMTSFADRMSFSMVSDLGGNDLLKKLYLQVFARLASTLVIGGFLSIAMFYS